MKKEKLFLIIIVFLLIYYPPIFSVNVLHIIGMISWVYIILHKNSIKKNINIRKVFNLYIMLCFLMIYILIISLLNNNSFIIISTFLYWIIDIIPASIMIKDICKTNKYSELDLFKLLLIVGNIQGIFALLAFLIPEFQIIFINKAIDYGYNDVFKIISSYRMYGISSNLTFSTPIIQSIFCVLSIYLSINKNIKYILFTPLLAFSAVINARASIVIMLVGLISLLITMKFNGKCLFKMFLFAFLGILSLVIILNIIKKSSPETYIWIDTGTKEIFSFLQGKSTGYFNYITDKNKYALPSGLSLIFGKGIRVMQKSKYKILTDVGWINDIWMGGIFYCILIYLLYFKLLIDISKYDSNGEKINKFLSLFFLGTFLAGNFKGYIITSNEIMTILFLIYIFISNRNNSSFKMKGTDVL